MKKLLTILKWLFISVLGLLLLLVLGLTFYTLDASKPLDEMYEEINLLDVSTVTLSQTYDTYTLTVDNPIGNIIIIPGGKVYTESYMYLAYNLALNGYQVYLTKALFHLAILNPYYTSKFLSSDLPNIIIGHSLGGSVGSFVAGTSTLVSDLILLGSYATNKIDHSNVLLITAQNDLVLNQTSFNQSLSNYKTYEHVIIEGGNHAGFGYYGIQKGDGIAEISIKEQQQETINIILDYLIN